MIVIITTRGDWKGKAWELNNIFCNNLHWHVIFFSELEKRKQSQNGFESLLLKPVYKVKLKILRSLFLWAYEIVSSNRSETLIILQKFIISFYDRLKYEKLAFQLQRVGFRYYLISTEATFSSKETEFTLVQWPDAEIFLYLRNTKRKRNKDKLQTSRNIFRKKTVPKKYSGYNTNIMGFGNRMARFH